MKFFIVGLGLMGASYALGLKNKGYDVYGYDINNEVVNLALNDKLIKGSDLNDLSTSDIVILCLYPKENITFVKDHIKLFSNQLVTDIAGTKGDLIKELVNVFPNTVRYVSHHPMAGRENSGYKYHETEMFKGANFLIVETPLSNKDDINIIKKIGRDLEFGRITELTPLEHDKLIAHTSQLTHLLAVGLMINDDSPHTKDATGDSFRDLTRIAKINEVMWTELFLDNKEVLVCEIDRFIESLNGLKELIRSDSAKKLKSVLKEAKEKRLNFDEINNGKL